MVRTFKQHQIILFLVLITSGMILFGTQARIIRLFPIEKTSKYLSFHDRMVDDRLQIKQQLPDHQEDIFYFDSLSYSLFTFPPGRIQKPTFDRNEKNNDQLWLYYLRPPPSAL